MCFLVRVMVYVWYVIGYQPGTHWGGGISHTAEKPRQYKLAWIGNQLMQPGKVNMDKARSAYTTYSCTAVICESVWNIKDNKSVLMTGFPYLKDRETPYVKTWGDFWKTLHKNKAAKINWQTVIHIICRYRLIAGTYEKCNAYYTFINTVQMWQGHKDTKLDI